MDKMFITAIFRIAKLEASQGLKSLENKAEMKGQSDHHEVTIKDKQGVPYLTLDSSSTAHQRSSCTVQGQELGTATLVFSSLSTCQVTECLNRGGHVSVSE